MEVSDGSRERAIHDKATELVSEWIKEMTAAIEAEEGDMVNGTILPAYITAGYVLYLRLKDFVQSRGGTITEITPNEKDKDT